MIDTETLKKTQAPDMLALASALVPLGKTSSTSGGEWSGPCPFCGGDDRFSVQPYNDEARWLCRGCTDGKWTDVIEFVKRRDGIDFVDACNVLFGKQVKIALDPQEYDRIKSQRDALNEQRKAIEIKEYREKRESLHDSGVTAKYYANLDKFGKRDLWHARGLSDFFIDLYQVGYCPSFGFGEEQHETLTIPTWKAGKVVGLSHRALVNNPSGGRYRPERSGLGKALFFADPDVMNMSGDVLILEGEIKTMVTFAHIYAEIPKEPHQIYNYEIIGISGTAFKDEWVSEFDKVGRITICLDPDATDKAEKIAAQLGAGRCKIVELPGKIDDLLIEGSLCVDSLYQYIKFARV